MFFDLLSHLQGKKGKANTFSGTSRSMDITSNQRLYMLHDMYAVLTL